ncbi:hypothetical protein K3728_02595 [Rhodobacteraceae bacterium M385]|nr:hypothetical protein K3728_02595 [Rhodobacteraceae bacterium M385]
MEPQTKLGTAALTKFAYEGVDLIPFRDELAALTAHAQTRAGALMDLSTVEQLLGNRAEGLEHQAEALSSCRVFRTHRSKAPRKTLLVYAASLHMGGNTPIEFLLHNDTFDVVTFYPDLDDSNLQVPPRHDVAFCAAPADGADADKFFATVRAISALSDTTVINLPPILVKPKRDLLPDLFADVPGLHLPQTALWARHDLTLALREGDHDWGGIGSYPFVVRPEGSHAGHGLRKIETRKDFLSYLSDRPEKAFYVSEFIDYASPTDRCFRKYRIIVIDGKAYPCHMAVSDQWNVWYMNANMAASEEKRQEEAAFMAGFATGIGKRHAATFELLAAALGLDYFGIDCAEDAAGNLILFEADNALIVHDMDCERTFPYKKAPMNRVFAAFETLLLSRCTKQPTAEAAPPVEPSVRH